MPWWYWKRLWSVEPLWGGGGKALGCGDCGGGAWLLQLEAMMQLGAVVEAPPEELEKSLEDLVEQYKDHIRNIDFRLNTQKVKSDIKARTSRFLKLRR